MKLLIGTLILGSLISFSTSASSIKKISSVQPSSYEIVTNSREEYFKVKNNLLISMFNRMDWSKIDLDSSSSYTVNDLEQTVETTLYNEQNNPKLVVCDYKFDYSYHIIVKDEKVVAITQRKNKKTIGSSDCRDDLLSDELEVDTFLAPTKEDYKNILINALDMHAKYATSLVDQKIPVDEKVVFQVNNNGYVAKLSDGSESSRHINTPASFDFIFDEDMTYLSNLSMFNIEGLDKNAKITFICRNQFHYSGESNFMVKSYYKKFSPDKINCKDTIGEEVTLSSLLEEFGI